MMYSAIVKKQNRKDQSTGVFIANCSAVLGVVMGVIGTSSAQHLYQTVTTAENTITYFVQFCSIVNLRS